MSWSNGLGMKNVVELCTLDMSRSSGVFTMELHCKFWYGDFGSGLPEIVFAAISLLLNEVLVRATGAQDFRRILSYITVCGYDTTYLQENSQRLG